MKMLVFFVLYFLSDFMFATADVSCVENPADIAFLLDGSGSVGPSNFEITKSFVIDFINFFHISETFTKISVFQFNSDILSQNGFYFKTHSTKDRTMNAIKRVVYASGLTNFEIPLTFAAKEMFQSKNGDRNTAKNILVFITDGHAHLTAGPGNVLRDMNVAVYVVAIGSGVDMSTLELIATNSSYIYTVKDYSMIWNVKDLLTSQTCKEIIEHVKEVHPCTINKELCQHGGTCRITGTSSYKCYCVTGYTGRYCETDIDDCQNVTCHNNGTCIDHVGSFTCLCQAPFSGIFCETNWCDPKPADVVFLIDESASMDTMSLDYAVKHIELTVKKWIIDIGHFQIALVSFAKLPKTILHFLDVNTQSTLLEGIQNITPLPESSEIDKGMSMAQNMLLYSGRQDAKKIIILYSDGFPSSPENLYVLKNLHSVEVYAVAIGSDVSHYFLSSICRSMSRVFPHHSDSLWHRMMKDLIRPECNACTNSQEADLVIMVDTTSTIAENLQIVVPSILLKILSRINIGENTTKLALITYGQTTTLRFAFDVYSESNRMDLQRSLSSYEKSVNAEQQNVTKVLLEAVDLIKNSSLGARDSAKKIILIISEFRTKVPRIDRLQFRNKMIDVNTIGLINDEHSFEVMTELATSPLHIGTTGSFKTDRVDLFIDSFVEQLKILNCRLIV